MEAEKRNGHFTSSQASRLCASLKNGNPSSAFYTYVNDVKYEIAMGRGIDVDVNTKPLKYGSLMEILLFEKIGLNYKMEHKLTIQHPTLKYFSGTPDLIADVKIGEIKCFFPKNFCALSLCILQKDVELFKKEFQKEFWQCVANSILCNVPNAEIIAFMPYRAELIDIIERVEQTNLLEANNLNPSDYYFLTHDDIETLPYLPDDSKMKNINTFEFEVPKEDKEFLIERIKLASSMINIEL